VRDRTVFARGKLPWDANELVELVRYDRAGKWRVEGPTTDEQRNLQSAATAFSWFRDCGGEVFYDLPGGKRLYAEAWKMHVVMDESGAA
jgi:hypothetical protein